MRVKMLTFLPWPGGDCPAGEEIDLPTDVAAAYVRTGQAEYVATHTTPPEAAMLPAAQPRGNKHVRHATTRGQ